MRVFPSFAFIMSMAFVAASQGPLRKVKINKSLTMAIPYEFMPMAQDEQQSKYISDRQPIAMYSTEDGQVDLGVNTTSTSWGTPDLSVVRDLYRSSILSLYDKVDFFQDEIVPIDGRDFIVFEFKGTLQGREDSFQNRNLSRYVYIMYTPYDNRIMIFNFSAPALMREKWSGSTQQMMRSIRLR